MIELQTIKIILGLTTAIILIRIAITKWNVAEKNREIKQLNKIFWDHKTRENQQNQIDPGELQ